MSVSPGRSATVGKAIPFHSGGDASERTSTQRLPRRMRAPTIWTGDSDPVTDPFTHPFADPFARAAVCEWVCEWEEGTEPVPVPEDSGEVAAAGTSIGTSATATAASAADAASASIWGSRSLTTASVCFVFRLISKVTSPQKMVWPSASVAPGSSSAPSISAAAGPLRTPSESSAEYSAPPAAASSGREESVSSTREAPLGNAWRTTASRRSSAVRFS